MIFVFKTSVSTKALVKRIEPRLNDLMQGARWNFDLEDCDHILRIDSIEIVAASVKSMLEKLGFHCEELH
jgi:hypothetical protein